MQQMNLLKSAISVNVAGSPIDLSDNIKSLAIIVESCLSFDKHVNNVCKACYFYICALCYVQSSATTDTVSEPGEHAQL